MQIFIPITNNPDTNTTRTDLLLNFNWAIHEDEITVKNRIYHTSTSGDLISSIPFREKILVVDNADKINLDNGLLVESATYNEDPESYPNVVGQYDYMLNLNIGMLKSHGMTIDDNTKISELLLAIIQENVLNSDSRGKFN